MAAVIRPPDHTLLAPVAMDRFALAPAIDVDGVRFVRKVELHITVFGSHIGRALDAAIMREPALGRVLDELVADATFDFAPCIPPRWWRLQRDDLQTVIVEVDAPGVAAFFEACARRLDVAAHEVWVPPPPHVTLYTSDPRGEAGIGLRTPEVLAHAAVRAQLGDVAGLRAFRIAPP